MSILEKALGRLDEIERHYDALCSDLAKPEVYDNPEALKKVLKEKAHIEEVVETYRRYKEVLRQLEDCRDLLDGDEELRALAREEKANLEKQKEELEGRLLVLITETDPLDKKDTFLEIRAGAGGEEAALFAADLFRAYVRYAQQKGFEVELVDASPTELGGFKEVIALIKGDNAYGTFKYEGGVHRVQRVPITEASGRIHTSTVTVAVLPEADEVDVAINEDDLRIDFFRASGAGGQHVNKTDSAVRITHIPTGIVVTCQDERSQHKNKAKAMKVLRARLFDLARQEVIQKEQDKRRAMVGTGERCERIRTYNFPQNRVSDHRIGLTLYKLDTIMEGEMDELFAAVRAAFSARALESQVAGDASSTSIASNT
jgi:peptide chain release factor 1